MSSTYRHNGDSGHSGKRRRVGEPEEPENKDDILAEILTGENKALTDENKALTNEINQLKGAAHDASVASNNTKNALEEENIGLRNSLERKREEMASLRLAHTELLKERSQQQSVLELIQQHNFEVTIPVITHAQVMKHFPPLVASGNPESIDHLLNFVFLGQRNSWFCFREICEKDNDGLCRAHSGSATCSTHERDCRVMVMRAKVGSRYMI
ncbi:hypothetical protein FBEOM_5912 [Fusarium beomiforme]|uniref:Uncharacterized protein n=1 Tax=Fusarium beomiforme TaxID=44412 RepID=A0A9P5AK35_9HYPO|nr:hypothetical protein FBEOM_5912 [Fusarium beomiforme]